MDDIEVMEQPGYMAGMHAGQDWAAEAVRCAIRGQDYDREGATPALQETLTELRAAHPTIKQALRIVGILCGMDPATHWTGEQLRESIERWLAQHRAPTP